MMDTSAILGFKQPDTMQQLSGLLGIANSAQNLQRGGVELQRSQQQQEQEAISLNERKGAIEYLKRGDFLNQDGSLDQQKLISGLTQVAPTIGMKLAQEYFTAHQQSTAATQALNNLSTDTRTQIGKTLYSIPTGASKDQVFSTIDALGKQYKGSEPLVNVFKKGYEIAAKTGGQSAADKFVAQQAAGTLPQDTQQAMNTPAGVNITDNQQSRYVNLKPNAGGLQTGSMIPGTSVDLKVGPGSLESVTTDAAQNPHVITKNPSGLVVGTRPLGSSATGQPGMFTLPQGETQDTYKALQGERIAAQAAANAAPVLHDINRTIVREASKGLNTGALGELTQKLASATGFNLANEKSTDYNLLGKMLERSALQAAQGMGPHTNAGLEAAVRANGSLDYTPQAIKKIAYLNDAIVHGSELYRQGLEHAIESDPQNGVFVKRKFDQQWSSAATPLALRLKNAADQKNDEEMKAIFQEVGGPGSAQAKQLRSQFEKMMSLVGR